MKEITRINLASLPYNVEIEAKKDLEKYCAAIERNLGADADAMREIESRMVELLSERGVTGEKVIAAADVSALKQQLGEAKEFAVSPDVDTELLDSDELTYKPTKRLMRDTSSRLLGGVCSGVAAYLNTDPVLIRVIAVIAAVLSFGFAVPIYLLMWLIIPPARTAANRLEMAGRPVTLEALKDESELEISTSEPPILTFLRYATAGALLVGALGILSLLGYLVFTQLPVVNVWPIQTIVFAGLGVLSGVLLAVLFVLLAYALITKRFTRKMGVALIAIMVLGLASFSTGLIGVKTSLGSPYGQKQPIQNMIDNLDATALSGATTLNINAEPGVTVEYVVKPGAIKATVNYPKYTQQDRPPQVKITKDGSEATISAKGSVDCGPWCVGYSGPWVQIEGPAIENVVVQNGQMFYVNSDHVIESVKLTTHNDSSVQIQGLAQIRKLTFNADGGSDIDATGSSIAVVAGELRERGSIELANVQSYNVTVPRTCPNVPMAMPTSTYTSATEVKVNGAVHEDGQEYPCFSLERR